MIWVIAISVIIVITLLLKRMSLISTETARKLLSDGATVIDVRSAEEFRSGHVQGAINIPLDALEREMPRRTPDKNKTLLLHCLSGTRSGIAKGILTRMGYTQVFNLGSLNRAQSIVGKANL